MGVCNCFMICCTLFYVHSSFAIILMRKGELVALLSLSSWCLVIVVCLFLAVSWVCLHFVIVVFPDHTHLLFWHTSMESVIIKYIEVLEQVQHRATKLIPEIAMPYHERLKYLKLTTLELRRHRGDLIETFKILKD